MLKESTFSVRTFVLVIGLVILTACSSREKSVHAKQADLYFGAGTQSLMDQKYTEALKSLLKANELDPNNSEILNNLGMAYYFKGEKELAIKNVRQSLEVNEKNSDAKINLATIYYQEGEVAEAERLYKEVLKHLTYDKQARTFYNLGVLEQDKKQNLEAAVAYFKKSLKEDDNYCPSHFQLGMIYLNQKRFNTALRSFKNASLGTCTNSPAAHYYQGVVMVELKQFNDARVKFDEVDTRFKQSPFALKARSKMIEINGLEQKYNSQESHASRKVLESPEF
jgi:type IV pilus assembly protein PilF